MASRVVMPKLTDTMEEGVLLAWKKREGDPVEAGDVLAEIETDKAIMDLEAFASGILRKVLVQEGATVMSGTLIGVIAGADEDINPALTDAITAAPSVGGGTKTSVPSAAGPTPTSPRSLHRPAPRLWLPTEASIFPPSPGPVLVGESWRRMS
jgi:pyruvate dehydrogenase E2 component (dihydrolipoamide acetyltransferase)